MSDCDHPRLFVSYSWTTPEHEEWVLNLATELRESGVDVILDKWDLREGHDANAFMERMVTDASVQKVLLICDRQYAEKADGRSGGVGTETQIISAEVYDSVDQSKFVAVIAEKDGQGKPFLPTYYRSRIYIDLSDESLYTKNFEQLLRWIYDRPMNIKPDLGNTPAFINEKPDLGLGTATLFRRVIDSVQNSKGYSHGAIIEYFETFSQNLERFRIDPGRGESDYDEKIATSIQQFLPYRNEAINAFITLSKYERSPHIGEHLRTFFESIIKYLSRPSDVPVWPGWAADNFKFIAQELFLYCVTALLKYERFETTTSLTQGRYYVERDAEYGDGVMREFTRFRSQLQSLDYRNQRLGLRRVSLQSDVLKERCTGIDLTFTELMQADFVLFLADSIQALRVNRMQGWWPDTLLYSFRRIGVMELFARGESKSYFDRFKCIFGIDKKDDLARVLEAFNTGALQNPSWQGDRVSPVDLISYENLCSRV